MTAADTRPSNLGTPAAPKYIPPRRVDAEDGRVALVGFLKYDDGGTTCWLRRTVRADPAVGSDDRLVLEVVEEHRDAALGRTVTLARYVETCPLDCDVESTLATWYRRRWACDASDA